ncbi:parallel beta-helix domain-containing protein [Chondromyces crocatus]|uniref:Right handed beta helix domain-containing protein n=1 Tax=Chondromyces crocatus TaxID=52 RepID=A0A0K1EL67_CHOCO|nr:parallel beta-helix domain-containing protein [Chondromyces crocatus]AKT41422.1 uncharacterized protein CMC5_056220 [Chondromyces crocatus]
MQTRRLFYGCTRAAGAALLLASLGVIGAACGDDGAGGSGGDTSSGGAGGTGGSGGEGGESALPPGCDVLLRAGVDDEAAVQTALIMAEVDSTVCFSAGKFAFTNELSLSVQGVTLKGAGRDETVLDFTEQDVGANGVLIQSNQVTVESLAVINPPGDGIRANGVAGITFRNVAVRWDADAAVENGAYGLYPVSSTDVVIENCVVKGARDAGIYVGQSERIRVVDSEAFGNVAGIEIENSTDALVRNNYAHDNTAGILVFNLPGLPVLDGKRVNVFENRVENNNLDNFGVPGTTVAKVPPGIGIMILASDDNEIHGNTLSGNRSAAVLVVSYLNILFGMPNDPQYDKFPQGNYVHDNTYTDNGQDPAPLIASVTVTRPIPNVLWDGCIDAAAVDDGHLTNCVSSETSSYLNFNYCNDFPVSSTDLDEVACTYEPLPID